MGYSCTSGLTFIFIPVGLVKVEGIKRKGPLFSRFGLVVSVYIL